MKVMILTDLEGPAGINGRSDGIGNTTLNKPTAEQALVNEVNAVCDGLIAANRINPVKNLKKSCFSACNNFFFSYFKYS